MKIWHQIKTILNNNHCLYLLTVIDSQGSAPGRRGFKMLVSDNMELFGTIGGGIMEFNMVETAKELLNQKIINQIIIKQVHKSDKNNSKETRSGMICSGSQTIGFNYLSIDDLDTVLTIIDTSQIIEYSNNGIRLLKEQPNNSLKITTQNKWHYTELQRKKLKVHIFGSGHVSLPTSRLLKDLGFDVYLYDNRKNLNTFTENKHVTDKYIIDYNKIDKYIDLNTNDYVLLLSHKFTEDKLLLSQLLIKKIKYLGVLGSQNKINIIKNALQEQDFNTTLFDQIYAPVGEKIHSQTTLEIAVSIAAQMIKVKNSN